MPCTVVRVLRPLRCWMRMWMRPSCRARSSPWFASRNGSKRVRFWMPPADMRSQREGREDDERWLGPDEVCDGCCCSHAQHGC